MLTTRLHLLPRLTDGNLRSLCILLRRGEEKLLFYIYFITKNLRQLFFCFWFLQHFFRINNLNYFFGMQGAYNIKIKMTVFRREELRLFNNYNIVGIVEANLQVNLETTFRPLIYTT